MNGAVSSAASQLWMKVVFGRNPKRTMVRLILLVVLSTILFRFIFIPIRVSGLSMFPTYKDGKINVINHLAYRWSKPKRGDVVAFRFWPDNVVLLKRIVGLPGEQVTITKGRVYVNGELLEEPYAKIKSPTAPTKEPPILGRDEYFVIGDNRDITVLGAIHERSILGKVLF